MSNDWFNEQEFELDFITCVNMFSGMEYEAAVRAARIEMKEDADARKEYYKARKE